MVSQVSSSKARLQASIACGLAWLIWYWRDGEVWLMTVAIIATALALLAWISPAGYRPVSRFFERVTYLVLSVFTWLVLAAIYFLIFTPLRLWSSLRKRDSLTLKLQPEVTTYLIPLQPINRQTFDRLY